MDLTGHPHDIPLEPPATPWGARILLALVAMLFMLVALACGGNGGGGKRPVTTVTGPPKIASFAPLSGVAGETTVTLTGTGFAKFTAIKFGDVAATTAKGDGDTTITVQVPAGATTGAITVVTALGSHTTTTHFTVTAKPALVPVVNTFDPAEGPVGTSVTLTGIGFTGATQVSFGGVAATTFSVPNANSIQVNVPAGAQTGTIAVVTPGGIHTTDAVFTVLPTPARHHLPPTVNEFTPTSGAPGTRVVLTGTRMSGATQVAFNGRASYRIEPVDDQHLVAYVPMGATTGPITVSTTGGNGTSTASFTVLAAPAGSISFSPASGAPGDLVVVTGTGLANATLVAFGGVSADPEEGGTDTGLAVQVPAGAVTGPLTVFTPAGIITSTANFTVTGGAPAPALPTLTAATPDTGRPGDDVTLTGTGLLDTRLVYFNGARSIRFRAIDDTHVLAEVPADATEGTITLVTTVGVATWGPFHVPASLPLPVVTGFTPNNVPPETQVTIHGTNLENVVQVTFGTVPAGDQFYDQGGNLIATVPEDALEGPIAVETISGISVSTDIFHPALPAPPLPNGFAPDDLVTSDLLEIDGTGLRGVSAVVFTGADNTQVVFDKFSTYSDTVLKLHVPPQAVTGPIAVLYQGTQVALPGILTIHPFRPVISGFSPVRAIPGDLVTLTGSGLHIVTEVTIGGVALARGNWTAKPDGTALFVSLPQDTPVGFKGAFAVASTAGTTVSDQPLEITRSRRSTLLQEIRTGEDQLPVLDFPEPRRAEPWSLSMPQAPVFHPYYPSPSWFNNVEMPASRPDENYPHFTLNCLLPTEAFYHTLPEGMRREIENRGFRDNLKIMVVSQHNIWNADPTRAGYQANRDDYEFKPQYWLYKDAPATESDIPYVTNTSMIQVALFSPVGDRTARDSGLTLNGLPFGRFSDPVEVALGAGFGTDASGIGSYFSDTGERLVLKQVNYQASYGFWSLTLAGDSAAATLHLLVNDEDQAVLDEGIATGQTSALGQFAFYLAESDFRDLPTLSSLFRPIVDTWHRQALDNPVEDLDRISIQGDMLGPQVHVRVFDAAGNGMDLDPADVDAITDAQLSLIVPRETVSLEILTPLGKSGEIQVVGFSSQQ